MRKIKFIKIHNTIEDMYEIYYNDKVYPVGRIKNINAKRDIWEIKPFFSVLVEQEHDMTKQFFDMSEAANTLVDLYEFISYYEASLFSID